MDVTQLALTWVGWPNGEKLALTCVQIWFRPKWAQVIASQRKCTQALAKRSRKLTQVFNLRQLASPFGQGFRLGLSWIILWPYDVLGSWLLIIRVGFVFFFFHHFHSIKTSLKRSHARVLAENMEIYMCTNFKSYSNTVYEFWNSNKTLLLIAVIYIA